MEIVKNIVWDCPTLKWEINGQIKKKDFEGEIENFLALKNGGFAVVEKNHYYEAKIYNNDGALRAELENPFSGNSGVEFYYFNYEADRLVVVMASPVRDFVCNVNEVTGELGSPRETR